MTKLPENICIVTGIYPPEIGGPAEYARELFATKSKRLSSTNPLFYWRDSPNHANGIFGFGII